MKTVPSDRSRLLFCALLALFSISTSTATAQSGGALVQRQDNIAAQTLDMRLGKTQLI
jgi:hypothetical protein